MPQNGFTRLERLLRDAVEGSFGRLFGGYLEPMDVAAQLVQTMEDHTSRGHQSLTYEVLLHPDDLRALLENNPALGDDLARAAWDLGRSYGLPLATQPALDLVADEGARRHRVHIVARLDAPGMDTTQVVSGQRSGTLILAAIRSLDAYLIVQGRRHVPLDRPLLTIGRRPDNDIVLNSSSVSRQHAQIRWRFDRFVLYDVSNRGRTAVNGEPVSETVLRAGDVIALSDALLVYAEGRDDPAAADGDAAQTGNTEVYPRADHE